MLDDRSVFSLFSTLLVVGTMVIIITAIF